MYLGFDFGTQSVKAVITNEELEVQHEAVVKFDTDLPEFRTSGGVNRDERNPKIVTAQPLMWVKAVDIVLERLRLEGVVFEKIQGISGAAQQHGSVYWKKGAQEMLQSLDPGKFLHEDLGFAFTISHSPVWMDSSTTKYCEMLEDAVGGPKELSKLTGSRAYERFTGSQIAKIYETKREVFNNTERISLVSSFACSLFLGKYAEIDYSDGSGMNLLNIKTKEWADNCLNAITSPDSELKVKLGNPVPTERLQGQISPYFVERFGFNPECKILSFTGDNPSSFAGMCLGSNDIAVSLGTSDTLFLSMKSLPEEGFTEGHILANPIASENEYMALLCFKNGSLTRERIRATITEGSWTLFNQLLDSTVRGNFGNIGFYYDLPEILPKVRAGDHRFNKEGQRLSKFSSIEVEVRALIEGQILAKRVHAERIGCKISSDTRILATGGASSNLSILQVIADVFNAPVYVQNTSNSADLGACYRLKHSIQSENQNQILSFSEVIGKKYGFDSFTLVCTPSSSVEEVYDPMVEKYSSLEKKVIVGDF